MKVLLIEDEIPAAKRLEKLLLGLGKEIEIIQKLDSIETTVQYLQQTNECDLIFMDIHLADGLSFEIFDQVTVHCPVIFTTAYDQYTLKAFKVNSIDYLLKPIDETELQQAIEKFETLHPQNASAQSVQLIQLMEVLQGKKYKERLLIKTGQQMHFLKTKETAYYFADGKLCFAVDFNGNKFMIDYNLMQLEEILDPAHFFRINRNIIVHIERIKKVHTWLGGRLKVDLTPATTVETIVSRDRVNGFKVWLGE
ncbi:MAG: LytR/AlgR family response regulator transcription factor [Ferruginibacter sp.]